MVGNGFFVKTLIGYFIMGKEIVTTSDGRTAELDTSLTKTVEHVVAAGIGGAVLGAIGGSLIASSRVSNTLDDDTISRDDAVAILRDLEEIAKQTEAKQIMLDSILTAKVELEKDVTKYVADNARLTDLLAKAQESVEKAQSSVDSCKATNRKQKERMDALLKAESDLLVVQAQVRELEEELSNSRLQLSKINSLRDSLSTMRNANSDYIASNIIDLRAASLDDMISYISSIKIIDTPCNVNMRSAADGLSLVVSKLSAIFPENEVLANYAKGPRSDDSLFVGSSIGELLSLIDENKIGNPTAASLPSKDSTLVHILEHLITTEDVVEKVATGMVSAAANLQAVASEVAEGVDVTSINMSKSGDAELVFANGYSTSIGDPVAMLAILKAAHGAFTLRYANKLSQVANAEIGRHLFASDRAKDLLTYTNLNELSKAIYIGSSSSIIPTFVIEQLDANTKWSNVTPSYETTALIYSLFASESIVTFNTGVSLNDAKSELNPDVV